MDLQQKFIFPTINYEEGIINFKIIIDEGKPFSISKVEFVGAKASDYSLLRQQLLIKEGELFSQTLFDKTRQNINSLDMYAPLRE